jgi:hypothetical protein
MEKAMAREKSKLRVGVIGPGGAGSGRTAEFVSRDDVEVVAAADNREAAFDRLEERLKQRVEGYPRSNIDNLVGLVKGKCKTNYASGINGIRTSLLTNSIILSGKGPREKNRISCDEVLENEGYSMEYVKALIAEAEENSMF